MGMLAEIFQKPKPVIGKVQLLPLPGSPNWDGHWDHLYTRAEQEATALATGGVDALLIENFHDSPHSPGRIDMAAAVALAMIVRRIKNFTQLPVGLSVLQNDPETALAVAVNADVLFMRMPLVSGALITESGVIQSKLNELLHYKNRLKTELPFILSDVSLSHLVPEQPGGEAAHDIEELNLQHLVQVGKLFARQPVTGGLIVSDADLAVEQLPQFQAETGLPVFVENRQAESLDAREAYYGASDGLILEAGVRKRGSEASPVPPTIDLTRVEAIVNRLKKIKSVTEMDPDIFLSR